MSNLWAVDQAIGEGVNKYRAVKMEDNEELEPGSFFVIRRQDVVGAQTLYAYAHLLQSLIEADTIYGFMDSADRERLALAADDVCGLADKWRAAQKKIPD